MTERPTAPSLEEVVEKLKKGAEDAVVRMENYFRSLVKAEFSSQTAERQGWSSVEFKHFYLNPCIVAVVTPYEPSKVEKVRIREEISHPPLYLEDPRFDELRFPGSLLRDAGSGDRSLQVYRPELFGEVRQIMLYDEEGYELHPVSGVSGSTITLHKWDRVKRGYEVERKGGVAPLPPISRFPVAKRSKPNFEKMFTEGVFEYLVKQMGTWLVVQKTCWSYPCMKCFFFTCWWEWCTSCGDTFVSYNWLRDNIVKGMVVLALYAGRCVGIMWDSIGRWIDQANSIFGRVWDGAFDFAHRAVLKWRELFDNWKERMEEAWKALEEQVTGWWGGDLKAALNQLAEGASNSLSEIASEFLSKVRELEGAVEGTGFSPAIIRMKGDGSGFDWWAPREGVTLYYLVFESTR